MRGLLHAVSITILACLMTSGVRGVYTSANHDAILTAILTGFDTATRPVPLVDITIGIEVSRITGLDIVEQTFGVSGSIIVTWMDKRLKWNKASYGGMDRVFTFPNKVWTPPLVLSNGATDISKIGTDNTLPVSVTNAGRIFWTIPMNFHASCEVDITYYPFDRQTCKFKVSSWQLDNSILEISQLGDDIPMTTFEDNGEWAIESSHMSLALVHLNKKTWSSIEFTFKVKRKYAYYMINIIVPLLLLNLLGLLVFTLPPESGEKVGFSVTILLSLSVLMTIVADNIPTTSLSVPLISVYLLLGFTIGALEVFMTVVVLKLFNYEDQGLPVSRAAQSIAGCIAKVTCHSRSNDVTSGNDDVKSNNTVVDVSGAVGNWMDDDAEDEGKAKKDEKKEYSWKELCFMVDTLSFRLFGILTALYTLAYLLIMVINVDI